MPIRNKVAVFGFGHIGRAVLTSGAACLALSETKEQKEDKAFELSLKSILEGYDHTSLIKAYKEVQRKYYPERDTFNKKV